MNNQKKDMQSHIKEAFKIINADLPINYVVKVRALLTEDISKVTTDDTIKNVRQGKQKPENQPEIFKALLSVAQENKKFKDELAKQLES